MIRLILFLFIATGFSSSSWVSTDISGTWMNADKDAHIKIYPSYGKFYGQIVWMKQPNDSVTGKPQLDKFNKDPKLRSRPVLNMVIIRDLEFDSGDQEWSGGKIYNPKGGDSYDLFCKLIDKNTLEVHFYMTIPALGRTFTWTRIK
ncbi:DUF2147 domain-containing protein [soil metagenome]